MNRTTRINSNFAVCALLFASAAALGGQAASNSDSYEGVSNPPANDEIVVTTISQAKPPAGKPVIQTSTQTTGTQTQTGTQAASVASSRDDAAVPGNDDGIVQGTPQVAATTQPTLSERTQVADADGDIVHPRKLGPGELGEGTVINVRLLNRLSTATSEKGEAFRTQVASDVLRDGQVLIPAGSEIDGRVVEVSSGRVGSSGTMHLRPETIILSNGSRFHLHAETTGTNGSRARVEEEGGIRAESRIKRDSIEYGGAVGAGAATGAVVGGPVGALTGSLIGAGVVTAHLLVSHPQAVLETGTMIQFTLSEPLRMVSETRAEN
jgi:hypothetical protein